MRWPDAEAAIRAHIEAGWAAGAYASTQLLWENETYQPDGQESPWVYVSIEGASQDKGIYGSVGKRASKEIGIVYYTAFVPAGSGRTMASWLVDTMAGILELQHISTGIYVDGANPPSPAEASDVSIPGQQPSGVYYRVGGSVEFIVTGAR
jgi:hypothetical protein